MTSYETMKALSHRVFVDGEISLGEFMTMAQEAIAAEREACARVAESICQHPHGMVQCEFGRAPKIIAAAIRARTA